MARPTATEASRARALSRARSGKGPTAIVFCHWDAHPWRRVKRLGGTAFDCGLEVILENMTRWSAGCRFEMVLVVNEAPESALARYEALRARFPFIREVICRRTNVGMDFGAYDTGVQWLRKHGFKGDVVLMNTSVNGPHQDRWLAACRDHFYARRGTGLCGASVNSHTTHLAHRRDFRPHLQSFFVFTNMAVLGRLFPRHLPAAGVRSGRTLVISRGEIGLSRAALDAGLSLACVAFPHFRYRAGGDYGLPGGSFRHLLLNRINLERIPRLAPPERRPRGIASPDAARKPPVRFVPNVRRVAVFGAGQAGREASCLARACGWEVAAFLDNDESRWGEQVEGRLVASPDSAEARAVDLIIVASSLGRDAITRQLQMQGLQAGREFIDWMDTVQIGDAPPVFVALRAPAGRADGEPGAKMRP